MYSGLNTSPRYGQARCSRGASASTGEKLLVKASLVSRIVAGTMGTELSQIVSGRRGMAHVARARQVVAYLLHTSLSMSFTEVAEFFSKDRTTISHACRLVEDLRDDPEFDRELAGLEETVMLIRELCDDEL